MSIFTLTSICILLCYLCDVGVKLFVGCSSFAKKVHIIRKFWRSLYKNSISMQCVFLDSFSHIKRIDPMPFLTRHLFGNKIIKFINLIARIQFL